MSRSTIASRCTSVRHCASDCNPSARALEIPATVFTLIVPPSRMNDGRNAKANCFSLLRWTSASHNARAKLLCPTASGLAWSAARWCSRKSSAGISACEFTVALTTSVGTRRTDAVFCPSGKVRYIRPSGDQADATAPAQRSVSPRAGSDFTHRLIADGESSAGRSTEKRRRYSSPKSRRRCSARNLGSPKQTKSAPPSHSLERARLSSDAILPASSPARTKYALRR